MLPDSEREMPRETSGQAAATYDRVRPDCATGKATRPLARRGFGITCAELSAPLAAAARENLAPYDVSVVEGTFEQFAPGGGFALVFAATSWHWIDPAAGYRKAWEVLRSGGHLAIWGQNHVFPDGAGSASLEGDIS